MYYQDKDPVLKMFDSVKSGTKLIIPISIFKKMHQHNVPMKKLKEYVEEFRAFRNKWIGYNLGGSCVLYQSTKGNKYTISIYPDVRYEGRITRELGTASFNMWDEDGCESLLSLENCSWEAAPTAEFLDKLHNTIKDYEEGIIHCSECDKPIKKEEVAGSYFAGRYCKHCWETKWREIEARETYD